MLIENFASSKANSRMRCGLDSRDVSDVRVVSEVSEVRVVREVSKVRVVREVSVIAVSSPAD